MHRDASRCAEMRRDAPRCASNLLVPTALRSTPVICAVLCFFILDNDQVRAGAPKHIRLIQMRSKG
eukprot:6183438-Pleurochrysis_carterae.AAC.2